MSGSWLDVFSSLVLDRDPPSEHRAVVQSRYKLANRLHCAAGQPEPWVPFPPARRSTEPSMDGSRSLTDLTTLVATRGLHFVSAYATGHVSPSSRFAASWKPRVE